MMTNSMNNKIKKIPGFSRQPGQILENNLVAQLQKLGYKSVVL